MKRIAITKISLISAVLAAVSAGAGGALIGWRIADHLYEEEMEKEDCNPPLENNSMKMFQQMQDMMHDLQRFHSPLNPEYMPFLFVAHHHDQRIEYLHQY